MHQNRSSTGPHRPDRHTWRALALGLGSLVFLLAVSWLPYRVPVARVNSDSYVFGYNNRVAVGLTAFGALLLLLFGPELQLGYRSGKALTRSTLQKALAVSGVLVGGLYLITRRLDGVAESIYLIDRIKLLQEGQTPYKAFEYAYGASFLYLPAYIAAALHVPTGDGYGLFWIALVLLGTYLLYKTLVLLDAPEAAKRPIFLLFWAFSLPNLFSFGITYTLFRYALPCFFGTVLYRSLAPAGQPRPQPWTLLWPVPMYAALLLVSQELAVAFIVGVLAYLLRFGHLRVRTNLPAFVASLIGLGGVTYVAVRAGVFYTFRAFGSGGFNLPVRPAPYVLLFFLLVGLAATYAGQRLRTGQPDGLLMLAAVSFGSLAAALGRCDPLHVLPNPLGLTMSGCFVLLGIRTLRRFLWPAMWLVFPILYTATVAIESGPQLAKAALPALFALTPAKYGPRVDRWVLTHMKASLGPQAAAIKFRSIKAAAFSHEGMDVPALFHLPANTIFEAPFGFTPGRFGTYHSPSIEEGFYFENENVLTPDAVARKVQEMRNHPERPLLLLPGREYACTIRYGSPVFAIGPPAFYPYLAQPVHVNDVLEPMCQFIRANYHRRQPESPETFGYTLWLPGPE